MKTNSKSESRCTPNGHDEVFDVDEALLVVVVVVLVVPPAVLLVIVDVGSAAAQVVAQVDSYAHLIAMAKTKAACKSSDKAQNKIVYTERQREIEGECP